MATVEGAPAHGAVAHLLPQSYKRMVAEWLEEDTPSFDYGGFVVGEDMSEAKLLGKSEVGPVRKLLLGERVALNTLARCSGIATKSARLLALLRRAGYPNILAGTRKTTPGFRLVEKYGMLVGGVDPHRQDLSTMTMLKDNHIVAAGSITSAVRAAKAAGGFAIKVEVECQSSKEADEAIAAGADVVMLDNFSGEAVKIAAAELKEKWGKGTGDRKAFLVEVSGGLTEENVESYTIKKIYHFTLSPPWSFGLKMIEHRITAFGYAEDTKRLVDLYYEFFHNSHPICLPRPFLTQQLLSGAQGLEAVVAVIHYIGSRYAPWTTSEAYKAKAEHALSTSVHEKTGFRAQALLLFGISLHFCDDFVGARENLDAAINLAFEIGMHLQEFARQYGQGSRVLEESWRRTFWMMLVADQQTSIVRGQIRYLLRDVNATVDLPCEESEYQSGMIPDPATFQDYDVREFSDVEIVFSSFTYLIDIIRIVNSVMRAADQVGGFTDGLVDIADTKLSVWQSLLPVYKREPIREDGKVDEVLYLAHMIMAIATMNVHRPLSALSTVHREEFRTRLVPPKPIHVPPFRPHRRSAHTAKVLKATERQTQLLAISTPFILHSLFTLSIIAGIATVQVLTCKYFLEDKALAVSRDRVRLSIGALKAFAEIWPLGKVVMRDVKMVARETLPAPQTHQSANLDPPEIEFPRDEFSLPIDPMPQLDIFNALVMPNWSTWDWNGPLDPETTFPGL
ncbi:hypothetical protein K432DRAFT_414025 [Lepidopterella palustris CBS 459.81]|uniref:Nicotinate-nucleotide pyrophosphorylase [carboxylating] n=1 Tax=Lepidopterella palustris CBS 459.81 TaxID=1314670 RepID=A0A8E2EIG1_9PEZI|nr:hypothetical protein K432DRAFT_414025 [Lepidopterella palustris CBS 459.81]